MAEKKNSKKKTRTNSDTRRKEKENHKKNQITELQQLERFTEDTHN
jgi:hypothetical protein